MKIINATTPIAKNDVVFPGVPASDFCHFEVNLSQYVPHDTAKLIDLQGGADRFTSRLDWIFNDVRPNIEASVIFLHTNTSL